jgi:class 3 adenylate cyclase/tetratricopeptide (TPR) repeat protein
MERKLATVLFVDLVGSTALVARDDPEVVRRRVHAFFDSAASCIAAHGGKVEKFAGDAVMAAFGIPQAHEDDAERAARAALAIREAVQALGVEVRIGLESGEVVADAGESTFATGEPVNLAARLQAEAKPGEILIGPVARGLALGRLATEPLGELQPRGFEAPIGVWRLVGAAEETGRRLTVATPFVGREAELELLENTWGRAVRDRRTHLFTVYGEPGVGKSRLVREFLAGVERATVLVGRCLPYGEAITYWPLAEMVKAVAGIADDDPVEEALEKLRGCCGEEAVAEMLGLASGVLDAVSGARGAQEIAWAAAQFAAELADVQPLVLAFEDIHWAEEPLLDLIEHLADRVRGVPLLVVCLARPELLDLRAGWGGGRLRATAIELEPLGADECETLVDALLHGSELPPEVRRELVAKTEGNPLFVEETVRMFVEDGALAGIPDSVQALIASRIDRLPRAEKDALQHAAVIGRVFWGSAVAWLGPDADEVADALQALVDRELVRLEARSTIRGEQAYRFKHGLIREVAYAGLTKTRRTDLHRAFAAWLKERGAEELAEIRAYHLDQAAALHEELDGAVPPALAAEAAAALHGAGRRALARASNRTARRLLGRAVELEPTLERRFDAARAAWCLDLLPVVAEEMAAVRTLAVEKGDARIEGRALTALAEVALLRDADLPQALEYTDAALELLGEDEGEERYHALAVRSRIGWWLGDLDGQERSLRAAREIACSLGRVDLDADALEEFGSLAVARLDLDSGEALLFQSLELAEVGGNSVTRAWALHGLARVHQLLGRPEDARAEAEEARELFQQAGVAWGLGRALNRLGWIARERGDLKGAERHLRDAIRLLKGIEDRGTLCESQRALSQVLLAQSRVEEAEQLALEARETVGPHDAPSRATTRTALALVRAAQHRDDEAEGLLHEALEVIEGTDLRLVRREVLDALVAFLRERGRADEAAAYASELASLAPSPA